MLLAILLKCCIIFLIINPSLTDNPDRFEFEDCGSSGVIIHEIDMTPRPFIYPGVISAKLKATVKHSISSFDVNMNIVRTINGIQLPIKCFIFDGANVGSCRYSSDKVCDHMNFWTLNVTQSFVHLVPMMKIFSLIVKCPENTISEQYVDINNYQFEIPDISKYFSFLASGIFNTTIIVNSPNDPFGQPFFCGKFKYVLKPRQ
ncbi:unnamed protein product [Adineta ricciae]|uniref:Ganglioside GM2 activator-like protein n=1 Tax=Adineta ricciae TaxID=249248 RepID=A0A815L8M9_ADIRI|nr:unnamed protein product [Adineta ricciae]CAF1417411.1 unnamed protein product [Adineta ricciae]